MELKNRIIEIIEKSGLTPSEFADKIGVQRSAISHITSGRNNPSLDFLIKIKNEFQEIDTDWLIFGIEKEKNEQKNSAQKSEGNLYPTLFDKQEFEEKNMVKEDERAINETGVNKPIKRIIILYKDGSFEDFIKK